MNRLFNYFNNIWTGWSQKQKIAFIIGLGLLIRFGLMPFLAHEDLFLTYGRAYTIAFQRVDVVTYTQQLAHAIEVVNLWIYNIFFDSRNLLPLPLPTLAEPIRDTITNGAVFSNPNLLFNLFWFKIPYLLFDLGSAYLLYRIMSKSRFQIKALAFFWLNPFLIFAVYAFSRYESFPIFFLLLTILLVQRGQHKTSSLAFAMMILTRTSMLLLLPVYLLTGGKSWRDKIVMTIGSILPYVLTMVYKLVVLKNQNEIKWFQEGSHTNFMFDAHFDLIGEAKLYPFLIGAALICYLSYLIWQRAKGSWESMSLVMTVMMCWFYAMSFYHPQYLAWVIPLFAISIVNIEWKKLLPIAAVMLGLFPLLLLTFGEPLLMGIFRPANEWLGTRDLAGVIDNFYSSDKLANIARSVYSAAFIIFAYWTWPQLAVYLKSAKSKWL